MQRRRLLQIGLGAATILAVAGGGIAMWHPGLTGTHLSESGRHVFRAIARAVLEGSLPTGAQARDAELASFLARLDKTISAFPDATRRELSQLLALLDSLPGRVGLAGLRANWADASVAELQAALESMRTARLGVRQQAYHALRDLTNAAWYSDPATWPALGYPGPRRV